MLFLFFFQAEDGIRDRLVTGVQTCALPISVVRRELHIHRQIKILHRHRRPNKFILRHIHRRVPDNRAVLHRPIFRLRSRPTFEVFAIEKCVVHTRLPIRRPTGNRHQQSSSEQPTKEFHRSNHYKFAHAGLQKNYASAERMSSQNPPVNSPQSASKAAPKHKSVRCLIAIWHGRG